MMKKIFSVILCSVLMVSLVACGKAEEKKEETSKSVVKEETVAANKVEPTTEVKTEEIKSSQVVLYFSDDQAMYLVGEKRNLEKPTAKSIVAELVKGPSGTEKLTATIPEGVVILDVAVKENIAYVDFKGNVSEKISGSTGEQMALYSIVNTLVSYKDLGITKVQFLIEGKKVESIAGHLDTSQPMGENTEILKK
ncbi:GerMN domain-containing protein [Clostridium bowmanii]|uniref:GerMN domain-containing protein n=1 Tax=Clostridium bowmanii TaxID=132925 RepID=UPI001C0AA18C|nr:GerMN domain-containing protein [Clostridium bowmanii]MBU3189469.1 GerMN domain-containing protein [Clostridium bowmanii]MCA1074084.1 GerMN domain-containing protein [Clostridium bowmanii]